jgi:surface protein
MAVNLGSTPIANIYIGNTQIQNVYLGNALVYSASNPFTFTVNTATTSTGSSAANQYKLPLVASFNGVTANVDWGDGTSNVITAFDQAAVTHTYASSGIYEIKISGALRGFVYNNAGDILKINNISKWGVFEFDSSSSFRGTANLRSTAADAPIISATNMSNTFRSSGFNGLVNWNFSNVTNLGSMFFGNSQFNSDVSLMNTSNVTDMGFMFIGAIIFDQSLSTFDIRKVNSFSGFLQNTTISTANYDVTLISWNNQVPLTGKTISFGNAKYTLGGAAAAARASLISVYGWTITDGGGI